MFLLKSSLPMRKFRLTIAYRGTAYQGWQKQAVTEGPPTVQEALEQGARAVFGKGKISIHGSGRTDSGVHARAQVASLRVETDLALSVAWKAINAHLPEDIRIVSMEECAEDFNPQLQAKGKTYRYFILHSPPPAIPTHWPFLKPYVWFVTFPLDYELMKRELAILQGTHDFGSFRNTGTPVDSTVRSISEASLIHWPNERNAPPWMPGPTHNGSILEIRISGSGFLKQMVRTIVGTAVEIGRGRFPPGTMEGLLMNPDRRNGGATAPPYGLFLDEVRY
jgi:tRNA pseudouridine38-40 synthase